jgi:hypothetical protein
MLFYLLGDMVNNKSHRNAAALKDLYQLSAKDLASTLCWEITIMVIMSYWNMKQKKTEFRGFKISSKRDGI